MLLFSDGFDSYNIHDLRYKWGHFGVALSGSPPTYLPVARIVSGIDTSCNKPWATKNGRALYTGSIRSQLFTTFRPSRTVYTGFAFRCVCNDYVTMRVQFGTKESIDRGRGDRMDLNAIDVAKRMQYPFDMPTPVGTLTMTVYAYNVSYTWTFPGGQTQIADLNTNMHLLNGDYHYFEVGMTLMGNVSALPQAWCELRVGRSLTGRSRHQNILTSTPDGGGHFYINAVSLDLNLAYFYASPPFTTIDDCYICNDEGSVNNNFLGNLKVRRATPSAEGSDNDATPTLLPGDARRFQAIDENFIGTTQKPYPEPTPEQDPLYIPWETTVFDDKLTFGRRGARQSFRNHSVDFGGSSPKIHGAILHGLARSKQMGVGGKSALKGYRRSGLTPLIAATPTDAPLSSVRARDLVSYNPDGTPGLFRLRDWQTFPMVFDNKEIVPPGQPAQLWSPATINDSEWVIELADCEVDPAMFDPNLVRFNLVNEEVCSEYLGFVEFVHRYFDAAIAESLDIVDSPPLYERTFKIEEWLYWSPEIVVYRTFNKSVNSTIRFDEDIPWVFLFAQSQIGFSDEIWLTWNDLVGEEIDLVDWATGFWEELFNSAIDITDGVAVSYIERLEEMFGLEEPYLWNGHEDVEESLEINVSYVWDNHELAEETLYPDDSVVQGVGLVAVDEIVLAEDHFNGRWVELFDERFGHTDSVLTQHWRYERIFGLVVRSWQVEPIEQVGNDGNHTGDNPEGW